MATVSDWTRGVEVRRHNGQCEYGPWMDIDDEDVPNWVEEAIADEIVEEDADEGLINVGGSLWSWRKGE